MKLQQLLSYVRRACDDYGMINEGDTIAVGVSGGKDSLLLLIALKHMERFYPKRFTVKAVTVSLGMPGFDLSPVHELCNTLDIPYSVVDTDIGHIIFNDRKEKNPCALCSKMRKGALHDEALRLGCNKIALGHNQDDVIETFFLSMFYEARIHTFSPVTYLDRKKLYSIRPLIYVPEKNIICFTHKNNIVTVRNPCPADGNTKRKDIKEFVREQNMKYDYFSEKIFGSLQRSEINGWKKE